MGPDGKVEEKIVDLTGNRPCFIDKVKEASLDSAQIIRVYLKPKPAPEKKPATVQDDLTPSATGAETKNGAGDHRESRPKADSAGFQINRLLALNDVHLRKMRGR